MHQKPVHAMSCRAALTPKELIGKTVVIELGKAWRHQPRDEILKTASGQQPAKNWILATTT